MNELYIFLGITTIIFITLYYLTLPIFRILRCKSFYKDTQKLLESSTDINDIEVYTTLAFMYSERLKEFEHEFPKSYKLTERFSQI